jgi:hypothetical protein
MELIEEGNHDCGSHTDTDGMCCAHFHGIVAQSMSDADYCHQLSRMFSRAQTATAVAAAAMNECDKGNDSVGISRLEEILNGRRIPLPPRG